MSLLRYIAQRFSDDGCTRMAASLSYTSLLAIVPLTAIAFSMLAAFPVFEATRETFQDVVFSNFLPQSAEAMREYLDQFVKNTASLTAVGIIGLALTAVLLLGSIESSLNMIFRVSRPRALVPRLLVFWALITLGPLLLGASFSLSTYFFAATKWMGVESMGDFPLLTRMLPTLIMIVVFTVFYAVIPNRPITWMAALLGGAVAGLIIAGLRSLFGLYVTSFPTYQTIYGAVSVVPIFLIWMYLSWTVVLLGAVITSSFDEWKTAGGRIRRRGERSTQQLVLALEILSLMLTAAARGKVLGRVELLRQTGAGEAAVDRVVTNLAQAGFIARADKGGWVILRDLEQTTLFDLFRALGFGLNPDDLQLDGQEVWHELLGRLVGEQAARQKDHLGIKLGPMLRKADVRAIKKGLTDAA